MQMEMMNILGSCDSSLIGWRGEFPHLSSSTCFATARFIRILEESYKLKAPQYKVITLGRIISDFASAKASTSGDAETFIFVCDVNGLLVSLGRHFDPYCVTRGAPFITWLGATHHYLTFCIFIIFLVRLRGLPRP